MKIGIDIDEPGFGRIEVMLANLGARVPDMARKTMRRAAERIVARAKTYVPEDTEALKDSIRLEVRYGFRRRLEIDIVMGGRTVIRSDPSMGQRLVNLDEYALRVHETYSEMNPGEKTKAKMERYPGKVGERFLTRAFNDDDNQLERDVDTIIARVVIEESR